jgi:hypothetical protein
MMNAILDTPYVYFEVEAGILKATYKKGLCIDLSMAKEIVRLRLEFTAGVSYPVLINNQGVVSIEKAARDYFTSAEATARLKAAAIIVKNPYQSLLGSFFVFIRKTAMPVRLFNQEEKAMAWLRHFIIVNP